MNVLVTGGTGFVGRQVLRQLVPTGHRIRLLVRNPQAPALNGLPGHDALEFCGGAITDAVSLPAAVEGIDAVIHLVGIISEVGGNTFEAVHARGTADLVRAAARAGVSRFVHMSALGTRPHAAARYHQTKWAGEETVRAGGIPWTILRPSLIYGPGDQSVNFFERISRWSPVLPVMGPGRARLQPVSVDAVAQSFVSALTLPAAMGQTLDVCGEERLTFPEILRTMLTVVGRRRLLVHVPWPLARMQAVLAEAVFAGLLGQAPPLNRDQLIMLAEDNIGDAEPARGLFGLRLESFRDGISRYLRR